MTTHARSHFSSLRTSATVGILALSLGGTAFADAKHDFTAKCSPCHGADGKGKTTQGTKMGVEDMTSAEWQGKFSEDKVKAAIESGVDRDKDGKKQKMEGYKAKLQPTQVDELAKFVKALGPAAGAAKPAEAAKPEAKPEPKPAEPTKAAAAKPAADAKVVSAFKSKCASCHGVDGKGTTSGKKNGAEDMTAAAWKSEHSVDKVKALLESKTLVEVKNAAGKTFKHPKVGMAAEQAGAIANYVHSF